MTDSKKPDDVLSKLDVDIAEPYVLALSGNKRVTFPSPMEMNALEADEFMAALNTPGRINDFFKMWLSEDDYDKLRAEKGFTLGRMRKVMDRINNHYEGVFGDMGEDTAS